MRLKLTEKSCVRVAGFSSVLRLVRVVDTKRAYIECPSEQKVIQPEPYALLKT